MPNELPIPDDLQHLIEKRESAGRRTSNRRSSGDVDGDETERREGVDRRQVQRRTGSDRFRPGDKPEHTGRYRCESCLSCINISRIGTRLPSCVGCGNRDERLYALICEPS